MNRKTIISLFFLAIGIAVCGQDNPITEFDLYGCWILERSEDGQQPQKRIYKRCENSDSKLKIKSSRISLLAFNESEIQTSSAYICFTTVTEKGTWTYDENQRVVSIYWAQEWLKEFKEQEPEEYAKFNSPEKFEWMKFKIIQLSDNQLEVEKTTHNKG